MSYFFFFSLGTRHIIVAPLSSAINTRQQDKVKHAILAFDRASRKARERRRNVLL